MAAFNSISESTTDVISGVYGGHNHKIIYAVFTTPPNSIPGSAVCAFSMRSILDTFEGSFKEQESLNSNWLPVLQSKVRAAVMFIKNNEQQLYEFLMFEYFYDLYTVISIH